ncbi:MAG TPA: hypothetical protein VFS21_14595 [Roseiflexaceae bacterium]|nr:hypothetical protein [Roseiflexaceae bacterium]
MSIYQRVGALLMAVLALAAAALATPTQARPAAQSPTQTVLLPSGAASEGLALGSNPVVWIGSDGVSAIDIATRRITTLDDSPRPAGGRSLPVSDGGTVLWQEPEGRAADSTPRPPMTIKGRSLAGGPVFSVNDSREEVLALALRPGRAFWARRVGADTQIVMRDLPPLAPPVLLSVTRGADVPQMAVNGPLLTWVERAGNLSSLRTLDPDSGEPPATLATASGAITRFERRGDVVIWGVAPGQGGPQQLFLQRIGAAPEQVASDVTSFALGGPWLVYSGPQGVVARDLAGGSSRTIAGLPVRPGTLVATTDQICWSDEAAAEIYCYSVARTQVYALNTGGATALAILEGFLLWVRGSSGPRAPLTVYAQPLAELLARATPLGDRPTDDSGVFSRLWERQDRPVQQGQGARSWTWGPAPISQPLREPYAEGSTGDRLVLYYDKSRMEINDPRADPNASWYVTNGLLPVELMTGRVQTGNRAFEQRQAAVITAVGDPGQFPTYADLAGLYRSPGTGPADLGKPATALLRPDGTVGTFNAFARDPATALVDGGNGHTVARAFASFMGQRGPVWENGAVVQGQVYDPLFVFGLPVTAPYWATVRVGGVEQPVLFQIFERRVLTYNPANPPAFRVEMGNVGQHYYQWRYGQ